MGNSLSLPFGASSHEVCGACASDNVELVKELIAAVKSPSELQMGSGPLQRTPLYEAASGGHPQCVSLLLEAGVDPCLKGSVTGDLPLTAAVERGHEEVVQVFVDAKAPLNRGRFDGETPLMIAVRLKNFRIMKILIEGDANPNKGIPLIISIENQCVEAVKILLLSPSIDVTQCRRTGESPVYVAAKCGNVEILDELLSRGFEFNMACLPTHSKAVRVKSVSEILGLASPAESMQEHFDIRRGPTPLIAACSRGYTQIVQRLIDYGANTEKKDVDDCTALMHAARNGHRDIIDILLKNNCDINCQDTRGESAILLASLNGRADVVELLCQHGSNVNLSTVNGSTPLFMAAAWNHVSVVDTLLKYNADLEKVTDNGLMPYQVVHNNIPLQDRLVPERCKAMLEAKRMAKTGNARKSRKKIIDL